MLHGCRQLVPRGVGLSPANERNPCVISCQRVMPGTLDGTAGVKPEEGGDDVKSSWPLQLGAAHVLQWGGQSDAKPQGRANRLESRSSVRIVGLQPARMKLESLVIADQHAAVNVFLSLVHTARQATKAELVLSEVAALSRKGAGDRR